MIKHVFVGFLNGADEILGERWYFRYHSKEVVRFFGPPGYGAMRRIRLIPHPQRLSV